MQRMTDGFVKAGQLKDEQIESLLAERTRFLEADLRAAQIERELMSEKATLELEAKKDERRHETRKQLIEEFAPIARAKFLQIAVEKKLIPPELAKDILESAAKKKSANASDATAARATFSAEEMEDVRAFVDGLTGDEMSRVYDVLGPESLKRLAKFVAGRPSA